MYSKKLLANAVKNYGRYINAEHSLGNDEYNMAQYKTDKKHFSLVCSIKCHLFGLLASKAPSIKQVLQYCDTNHVKIGE